jgi:hypothetical protein
MSAKKLYRCKHFIGWPKGWFTYMGCSRGHENLLKDKTERTIPCFTNSKDRPCRDREFVTLKPCPFCGSLDLSYCVRGGDGDGPYILCNGCYSKIEQDIFSELLELWNRRIEENDPKRMVDLAELKEQRE